MIPDVARRGTDSSGRPIYATGYLWRWWLAVCAGLGFRPTVTQGSYMLMAGGGATKSAGYHDYGGTFDLRVWNLSTDQVTRTIAGLRAGGAAAWLRNLEHGGFTDPHIHFVLGTDRPLSSGAAFQWKSYLAGGDGLGGHDYHPRPHPLVTVPPAHLTEEPMTPEDFAKVRAIVAEEIAKAGNTIKIDVGTKSKRSLATVLTEIRNGTRPR